MINLKTMARTDSEDLEAYAPGLDPATLRIVLIELAHVVDAVRKRVQPA